MRSLMLFVAVAASLLAAANVALADRNGTAATCATFRVSAIRQNGDVVLSNKVVQLRTMDVTCKTAHAIAKEVVTDILLGKRVPARINGYRIMVVKPRRSGTSARQARTEVSRSRRAAAPKSRRNRSSA